MTQPSLCPRATLQVLHQACEVALGSGLVPGGSALTWAGHYQDRLSSDQSCLNEWTAMADLESLRPPSAEPGRSVHGGEEERGGCHGRRGRGPWTDRLGSAPRPSEQEQMEQAIRAELWEVLDTSDLESITSKEVGRVPGPGRELGPAGGPQRGPGLPSPWSAPTLLSSRPEPVADAWPQLL